MPLAAARRRNRGALNYWPGFVDALSTLLLAIVFLLSIFVLGQFFLSQEISGRDVALGRLNRQLAELTELLSLERSNRRGLEDNLSGLQTTLRSSERERGRLQGVIASGSGAERRAGELGAALESEKQATARAVAQIELLNQQISALRRQLAAVEEALSASEAHDKESQTRIRDPGGPPPPTAPPPA